MQALKRNRLVFLHVGALVILTLTLACYIWEELMTCKPKTTTIGQPAIDLRLLPIAPAFGNKPHCEGNVALGGSVVNTAQKVQELGGHVQPVFLVAEDVALCLVENLSLEIFDAPAFLLQMAHTKWSAIVGDEIYTIRPEMVTRRLPKHITEEIAESKITIMSPMTVSAQPFVEKVLAAGNCLLQLSEQQLREPLAAAHLARRAVATIINHKELKVWTNESDPVDGINLLRELGVQNVIVTHPQGVVAFLNGNWVFEKAFEVESITQTVGAGDAFVGGLAWALSEDKPWKEAINVGLSTAARHVEGAETAKTSGLEQMSQERPRVALSWPERPPKKPLAYGSRWPLVAALLIGIGVGVWI